MTTREALLICAQAARERAEDKAELRDKEHTADIAALRTAAQIVGEMGRRTLRMPGQ